MTLKNLGRKASGSPLFRFLRRPDPPAARVEQPATINPGQNKGSILIVDDDAVIAKGLSLKLQSRGYAVVHAFDGSEAIQALRDTKPDLVLMDINFPPDISNISVSWDGFRLVNWLRGLHGGAALPVIFMTSADVTPLQSQLKVSRALDILSKPLDYERLLSLITHALNDASPREAL